MAYKGSVLALIGSPLLVGVMRNGTLIPLRFARGLSSSDGCLSDFYYCGQDLPPTETSGCGNPYLGPGTYNYGIVTAAPFDVYINVQTISNNYFECTI